MTESRAPSIRPRSGGPVGWIAGVALVALPVVWLDVYLLSPQEETAEYVAGRYSLVLAVLGGVALVVERLRGALPWAAVACAVLGWLGVVLGKVLGSGEGAYPWIIAAAAVGAFAAAGMPGAHRGALVRVGALLAFATVVGVVGLA